MSAPERLTCPLCERDYTPGSLQHHLRIRHAVPAATLRERWPDLHQAIRTAVRRRQDPKGRIACRICGAHLHVLGSHLLHVHRINRAEYLRRFPGAPLASDHKCAISADLHADRHGPAYWTQERIIAAIRRWAERTGAPPTSGGWARAARDIEIMRGDRPSASRPSLQTVRYVFGSWTKALRAAGFEPGPRGPARKPRTQCFHGGHDMTDPINVYVAPSGKRCCRACRAAKERERKRRRDEPLAA